MTPVAVAGAAEALEALRDAPRPFGLVLTDAMMPDHDGFELVREIRKDDLLSRLKVIMLTSGGVEAAPRGRAAIDRMLTKPVKHSELLEAIQSVMRPPAAALTQDRRPVRRRAGRPRRRRRRILVAEDNPINQKVVLSLLKQEGHAVTLAKNGQEAVAAAAGGGFDLILMDVQMPVMSGLEATAAIRARESAGPGRRVPIMAMTAHAHAERSGGVPAGRHGRLCVEADPARGTARGGRRHRWRTRRAAAGAATQTLGRDGRAPGELRRRPGIARRGDRDGARRFTRDRAGDPAVGRDSRRHAGRRRGGARAERDGRPVRQGRRPTKRPPSSNGRRGRATSIGSSPPPRG